MTTVNSLDELHTHVPPSSAPQYLYRVVMATLSRRGFDSAEAGALTEIERLLEHHIQRLFSSAQSYSTFSGRAQPNARDLLMAQEESGWDISTLRHEAKKRRLEIELATVEERPEPMRPVTLAELPPPGEGDVKPQLTIERPEYAWDNAPPLPDKWTYKPEMPRPPSPPATKVTSGVLDFIKLTATERGDIPPELGLVDYRRADGRETKRRWSIKGVGSGVTVKGAAA